MWLQQEVLNGNGQLVVAGIRGALAIIAREDTVLTPVSEFQIMCLLTTLNGIVSLVRNTSLISAHTVVTANYYTGYERVSVWII